MSRLDLWMVIAVMMAVLAVAIGIERVGPVQRIECVRVVQS